MNKGISIIICCYNSALQLPKTLEHIAKQNVSDDINWEVILINNNSSDRTVEVASEVWASYLDKVDFRIIDEPTPGLSNARKTGINNANYSFILFCDDDNWLNPNYVNTSYDIISNNANIGALGGQGFAVSEVPIPDWFKSVEHGYAVGKQSDFTGNVNRRGYLWGAGIVVRKKLLETFWSLDGVSILTGRNGNQLLAGDDGEMCKWILLLGKDLWYDERLKFKHFISEHRLDKEYMEEMFKGFKKSGHWLRKYDQLIQIKKLNRSKLKNFVLGLYYFLIGKADLSLTLKQFLIGPAIKVSSEDDFRFIKSYYWLLYK